MILCWSVRVWRLQVRDHGTAQRREREGAAYGVCDGFGQRSKLCDNAYHAHESKVLLLTEPTVWLPKLNWTRRRADARESRQMTSHFFIYFIFMLLHFFKSFCKPQWYLNVIWLPVSIQAQYENVLEFSCLISSCYNI